MQKVFTRAKIFRLIIDDPIGITEKLSSVLIIETKIINQMPLWCCLIGRNASRHHHNRNQKNQQLTSLLEHIWLIIQQVEKNG